MVMNAASWYMDLCMPSRPPQAFGPLTLPRPMQRAFSKRGDPNRVMYAFRPSSRSAQEVELDHLSWLASKRVDIVSEVAPFSGLDGSSRNESCESSPSRRRSPCNSFFLLLFEERSARYVRLRQWGVAETGRNGNFSFGLLLFEEDGTAAQGQRYSGRLPCFGRFESFSNFGTFKSFCVLKGRCSGSLASLGSLGGHCRFRSLGASPFLEWRLG